VSVPFRHSSIPQDDTIAVTCHAERVTAGAEPVDINRAMLLQQLLPLDTNHPMLANDRPAETGQPWR
jgi:hypothetical protein